MTVEDRIREANQHDLSAYRRWGVTGGDSRFVNLGFIRVDRLREESDLFSAFVEDSDGRLKIASSDLQPFLDRIGPVLVERGRVPGLAGEAFPVWPRVGAEVHAVADRRMVAWLGISASGVHVNVHCRRDGEMLVWIAKRALDKPLFPGQLDNAVAGGQPVGLGLLENVVKECGEEAGIPVELAGQAVAVGSVHYVFENESGLKPDTLHCYDLEVPPDFVPRPVDGEVDSFQLVSLTGLRELLSSGPVFKFNSALVCIDFLLRHAPELVGVDSVEAARSMSRRLRQLLPGADPVS